MLRTRSKPNTSTLQATVFSRLPWRQPASPARGRESPRSSGSLCGAALGFTAARWRSLARSVAQHPRGVPARASALRAPGRGPPRSGTFAYQMRIVWGMFFSWGVLVLRPDSRWGKGRSGILPGSPSSGRSLPRAFRPGRCPSVHSAQGQSSGEQAPTPGSRGSGSSAPARVPAPTPPRPLPEHPARIRFRTLAAAAKDRRTHHHRLKIRPPARAGTLGGGRALLRPGCRVEARAQGEGRDHELGFGMRCPLQAEGTRAWPLGRTRGRETPWSPRLPGKDMRGGDTGVGARARTGRHGVGLSGGPLGVADGPQSPGPNSP